MVAWAFMSGSEGYLSASFIRGPQDRPKAPPFRGGDNTHDGEHPGHCAYTACSGQFPSLPTVGSHPLDPRLTGRKLRHRETPCPKSFHCEMAELRCEPRDPAAKVCVLDQDTRPVSGLSHCNPQEKHISHCDTHSTHVCTHA